MKKLFVTMLCLVSIAQAASATTLPSIEVGPEVIEGSVLMIHMQESLVIPKEQQLALDKELGEAKRNQFYTEMVMEKTPAQLKAKYHSEKRPVTAKLIQQYESVLASLKKPTSRVGSL